MSNHATLRSLCLPIVLIFSLMSSTETKAVVRQFDNEAGDNDWFNPQNWQPDGAPADTDLLTVGGGVTAATALNVITSNGGSITISDSGTDVTFANLNIGLFGVGILNIQSGAQVNGIFTSVGTAAGSEGSINLFSTGTMWDAGQLIVIGGSGSGLMDISGGAQVTSIAGVLGNNPGSVATVTVSGVDTSWIMSQRLEVGNQGSASLSIIGATVRNTQATLGMQGAQSSGDVFVSGGGLWEVSSTLTVGGEGTGKLQVGAGGTVTSSFANVGSGLGSKGEVIIDGVGATWTNLVASDLIIGSSAAVNGGEGSVFLNNGGLLSTAGNVNIGNSGLVMLDGGTFQANGLTTVRGELGGAGTVEGFVVNQGVISPGAPLGTLTIDGNFQQMQNSTLDIEIGFDTGSVVPDVLDVNGTATLGGRLKVELVGGTVPGGEEYVVLAADALFGQFNNVSEGQRLYLEGPEMGSFQVNYGVSSPLGASSVVLSNYEAGLPGDYDNNGLVDGNDFLIWQRGESVAGLTMIDLFIWENNFGASDGLLTATATTVPEPTSAWLLILGTLAGRLWLRLQS